MNNQYVIDDIQVALATRQYQTITMWNRLEGRPRTHHFDRALKAEVRDALWMLTKQWQMGEFKGDDAGSPVFAKIHLGTTKLNKYQANGHEVQLLEENVPLETKVEQRPIPFQLGEQKIALDIRLLMGRQWIKMVSEVGDFAQEYIKQYPIDYPDPDEKKNAQICAHSEVWQQFAAVAGRSMDGAALYFYLKIHGLPPRHAYDGIEGIDTEEKKTAIDEIADLFIQWFENLFFQPQQPENNAWQPPYLEYQFACSAPEANAEKVLVVEEYYHGHLDWYNLDVDRKRSSLGDITGVTPPDQRQPLSQSFIPAPIDFEGMPNTRWWSFEDRKTNFGDVQPGTTDLAKLLLMEFGLVYANDWFLIPFTLPTGSISRIKGMAVTNVFGERFWIEAAGGGADDNWQRWSMFTLNVKNGTEQPADTSLLLLPTVPKIQESDPLEAVTLIRDEMANMVWGIETTVPLATGRSKSGHEAAIETRNFYQRLIEKGIADGTITVPSFEYKANIRYQVMNTVPENWIPFIPVHKDGDNREIQLQRAAMPRIFKGGPPPTESERVRPRTAFLQEGLDKIPRKAYYLHEEEVPRAGIRVSQSFQRTRWHDGRVFVWLGVRKQIGRGEGSSGLIFDQIVPVEPSRT
jgi:hypothetical protein